MKNEKQKSGMSDIVHRKLTMMKYDECKLCVCVWQRKCERASRTDEITSWKKKKKQTENEKKKTKKNQQNQ